MRFGNLAATSIATAILGFWSTAAGEPFTTTARRTTCPISSSVGGYVGLGTVCATGNVDSWLVFSNFTSSQSAADLRIQGLANAANEGFYFPVDVSGPLSFQLGFNIQAVNTLAMGLTFDLAASGMPRSQANVTMYVCAGQAVGCDIATAKSLTLGTSSITPYDTLYFTPSAAVGVLFVGNVDPGALLTQFESTVVTGTPEPATLSVMALGLLAIGAIRKRVR